MKITFYKFAAFLIYRSSHCPETCFALKMRRPSEKYEPTNKRTSHRTNWPWTTDANAVVRSLTRHAMPRLAWVRSVALHCIALSCICLCTLHGSPSPTSPTRDHTDSSYPSLNLMSFFLSFFFHSIQIAKISLFCARKYLCHLLHLVEWRCDLRPIVLFTPSRCFHFRLF